jgi:hypothetical protein
MRLALRVLGLVVCAVFLGVPLAAPLLAERSESERACVVHFDWKHHIPLWVDPKTHSASQGEPPESSEEPGYWTLFQSTNWELGGEGSAHTEWYDGFAESHHDPVCEFS